MIKKAISITIPDKDDMTVYTLGPINGDEEGIATIRVEWRGLRSPTLEVRGKDLVQAKDDLCQTIIDLLERLDDVHNGE